MTLALAPVAQAADEVGWQELLDRLGPAAPNGSTIPLVQVEAGSGAYMPDINSSEFAGKTLTPMSGTSSASWHGTEVGRFFYGGQSSMAWGASTIYNYEAGNWVGAGFLRTGAGTSNHPLLPPGGARVFNHSWIGAIGGTTDREALRRADFAMLRDFTLFICGQNNGAGSPMYSLMSMGYNGLSVGLTTGQHSAGLTTGAVDGAGRQKPEIVAPGQYTSFSAPVVGAAAALLYQTAKQPPLDQEPWASRGLIIKAVLLAGATHESTWANDAPQSGPDRGIATLSLDPVYGVGTLNVNRSHMVLTGGRVPASTSADPALTRQAPPQGWMQHTFLANTPGMAVYTEFALPGQDNVLTVACTWHRSMSAGQMAAAQPAPAVPNIDVTLYRREGVSLVPMAGSAGAGIFQWGNCVSQSPVNNLEYLHLRGLAPGTYVLEVKRLDAGTQTAQTGVAWFVDEGPVPAVFGDLNHDGLVSGVDLGLLLTSWGECPGCSADLDRSGEVNGVDLGLLLSVWRGA